MMKMVGQANTGRSSELPPQVNPSRAIIRQLSAASVNSDGAASPELTQLVAGQLLDNCLVAAGLVDDPRSMLPGLNRILEAALADKK